MTRSLWLAEALGDVPPRTPLTGDMRCDVCIVGGGFTGLWTALRSVSSSRRGRRRARGRRVRRWRERPQRRLRDDDVVEVLVAEEARRDGGCGVAGAAGRGVRLGDRRVLRRARHRRRLRRNGWVWAATSDGAARRLGLDDRGADRGRASARRWSRSSRTRSRADRIAAHLAGVFDPDVAHLQPARSPAGWRASPRRGHPDPRRHGMTALGRTSPPTVTTARGTCTRGAVVLAVNAWAARLPEVRRSLVVTSSDVIATPRDPAVLEQIGWTWRGRPVRVRLAAAGELLPPDTRRPRRVRQGRRAARARRADRPEVRRPVGPGRRRAAPPPPQLPAAGRRARGRRAGAARSTTRWTGCRSCTACRRARRDRRRRLLRQRRRARRTRRVARWPRWRSAATTSGRHAAGARPGRAAAAGAGRRGSAARW